MKATISFRSSISRAVFRSPCRGGGGDGLGLLANHLLQGHGNLRAATEPMLQAITLQHGLAHGLRRIVRADVFEETPVTRVLRIGHDDVVEGVLLGAKACKTNLYHELHRSCG